MDVQYKMIGGDGREYGPASLDEMKSWIKEGRIAGTTLIWSSDSNMWLPASQVPEFRSEFGYFKIPSPSSTASDQFQTVGFLPRLAAYVIDHIVVGMVVSTIWLMFLAQTPGWEAPHVDFFNAKSMEEVAVNARTLGQFSNKILVIFLPTIFLYEVLLNGRFGATLGKKIIGAKIVRMDGTPINYATAASRWVGERLSDMFLCYVGHLFVLFRPDKRALHDLIVGTRVVYNR